MMKGKFKGKRCTVKVKIFVMTLMIFASIHLKYLFSLDQELIERDYTMPDSLMKFAPTVSFSAKAKNSRRISVAERCNPKRGVVFLKTHKTGSTTMTNIFLRYAVKHELSVGLPPARRWELAGYPSSFKKNLIDPQLKKYEMLCHHFRMTDKATVSHVVPPEAMFITIIRDPINAFESGFSFFRDYPFAVWMTDYKSPEALKRFLSNPNKYYNKSTPWYFRAKNYQAFDLGFEHERQDDQYIDYVLQKMDSWFDLVMITERMDESLVLLKDVLCMGDMDDITYIRLKVRQDSLRRISDDDMKQRMRQWNRLDSAIYDHFLTRLEKNIEQYGKIKMENQVRDLRNRVDAVEKRCILEYDHEDLRPWISRIRLRRGADEYCKKLSWGEVKFGDYIRNYQKKYAHILEEDQISPDNMKMMLDREQRKILNI